MASRVYWLAACTVSHAKNGAPLQPTLSGAIVCRLAQVVSRSSHSEELGSVNPRVHVVCIQILTGLGIIPTWPRLLVRPRHRPQKTPYLVGVCVWTSCTGKPSLKLQAGSPTQSLLYVPADSSIYLAFATLILPKLALALT